MPSFIETNAPTAPLQSDEDMARGRNRSVTSTNSISLRSPKIPERHNILARLSAVILQPSVPWAENRTPSKATPSISSAAPMRSRDASAPIAATRLTPRTSSGRHLTCAEPGTLVYKSSPLTARECDKAGNPSCNQWMSSSRDLRRRTMTTPIRCPIACFADGCSCCL